MKVINDKVKVRAELELKKHKLTLAQSRVLAFLYIKGGEGTQREVEGFLGVAHPTVVGIVSRMKQNGFVNAWVDPNNRRNKIVCLTQEAKAVGEVMVHMILAQEDAMLEGLTPQEVEQLRRMLGIIYSNLDKAQAGSFASALGQSNDLENQNLTV